MEKPARRRRQPREKTPRSNKTLLEIYGIGRGLRHARKHLAAYAERGGSQNAADPA